MRFLVCGERGILVECRNLEETLRLFAAAQQALDCAHGPSGCDSSKSASGEGARPSSAAHDAALHERVERKSATTPWQAVTELIPAARTLLVSFDPFIATRRELIDAIRTLDTDVDTAHAAHTVEIPVCYDGADLADVADLIGMSPEHVIARHCGHDWSVAFVGFAPGFAYLTGGDTCFDVPRRPTPRLSVPSGAVGLAGTFSGVYPRSSSGGWQLIGHTDTPMWDETAPVPALLQPGDTVRFRPVREQTRAVAQDSLTLADSPAASETADDQPSAEQSRPNRDVRNSPAAANATNSATDNVTDTPSLTVIRPGILATMQDDGRHAANMGVTGSGAADPLAYHLANELVGNPEGTPAIELTDGSAAFRAHGDLVVAVTGAPVAVTITPAAGEPFAVTQQEAFLLRGGETVTIDVPEAGLRNYLAVAGGFACPRILGSAAADTMSGIGPAPLTAGQRLDIAHTCDSGVGVGLPEPWPDDLPHAGSATTLEVVLGPRDDWFTAAGLTTFLEQEWTVTAASNRVGLRLHGDAPLERADTRELASEATVSGAVEVPTSGQPVMFLRDQPVTGGYPVIAVLTPASLAVAGQLPPGAAVVFRLAPGSVSGTGDGNQPERPERPGKSGRAL